MKLPFRPGALSLLLCLPAWHAGAGELHLKLDMGDEPGPAPWSTAAHAGLAASEMLTNSVASARLAAAAFPEPFEPQSLPATHCCAGPMSLTEAVRIAVARHPSIGASTAGIAQQAGLVAGARAAYYPQITAGLTSGANGGLTTHHSNQVATVGASVMLYDFGKVASRVEQAEANARKQQALLPRQMDAIAMQAAEAVASMHRYQALITIAEDQVAGIARVLELAQLRAHAGLSSQSDPIQARSRLEAAQATLLQYQAARRQAHERLRTLLGPTAPELVADMHPQLLQDARLDAPVELGELPDVIAAEADHAAAVAALRNARAQGLPTLSLEGSLNQAVSGNIPGAEGRNRYATVAFAVSSNLWQGGAQTAAISAASAAVDAARAQTEIARLNAGDQIRALREQALGVQGRLATLGQRSLTIGQTRELYQEQYKLGTRSVLDLLSAEQEIFQSKADEQTAHHDLWQHLVDYIAVSGASRRVYALDVAEPPPDLPVGIFLR